MTKPKSQKKIKNLVKKISKVAKAGKKKMRRPKQNRNKGSRVGNIIRSVGRTAGNLFGVGNLGHLAGDAIARISGFGEYKIRYNTIMNPMQAPPAFADPSNGTRIRHREYVGTISSSTAFSSLRYSINPGLSQLFPWLSQMAINFEEYKLHGLVVTLNTSSATAVASTNTALGIWGAVTQYDPTDTAFLSRVEAENYVGCNTAVVCQTLLHGIECKPNSDVLNQYFVRSSSVTDAEDLKFYDHGIINIITEGAQAASVIGELWVSYDIEFFKPKLASVRDDNTALADIYNIGAPAGIMGGSSSIPRTGSNLGTSVSSNGLTLNIPATAPTGNYLYYIAWRNVTAVGMAATTDAFTFTSSGVSGLNWFFNNVGSVFSAPYKSSNLSGDEFDFFAMIFLNKTTAGAATLTVSPNFTPTSAGSYSNFGLIRMPTELSSIVKELPNRLNMDEIGELREFMKLLKSNPTALSNLIQTTPLDILDQQSTDGDGYSKVEDTGHISQVYNFEPDKSALLSRRNPLTQPHTTHNTTNRK
jgi:hypothetical protein